MTPIVAIVGRPNVGKSSLFNRLAGQGLAIVDDQPGVTRDRHYADALIHGRVVTIIDTGGFDPTTTDPMGRGIAFQVRAALDEADLVLCLLDGSEPPTGPDRDAVKLLRQSGKPVLFAANKIDNPKQEALACDLYSLGLGELYCISALHGRGIGELLAAIVAALPPTEPEAEESADAPKYPRFAILGRPNAGKSSLFNRLVGSERALVDSVAGTTRDPVDSMINFQGRTYQLVDTAGIRRRSRVEQGVEGASVFSSLRAMERADVVLLLCDAVEGIAEQDARLLGLCLERGRAIVVGINKMDLLDRPKRAACLAQVRDTLRFASFTTIVPISVKTGYGVEELVQSAERAVKQLHHRVGTAELNRFFEQVLAAHPPPTKGGRAPRIYYITQAGTAPPLFIAVSNAPEHIAPSYQRYLMNQIRKAFGFESVPLVVRYRAKDRKTKAVG
jgi:GTPase